jgi:hypothetical protein
VIIAHQFTKNLKAEIGWYKQIQLFTHTNAQVYTRADWDEAVCKVNKKVRINHRVPNFVPSVACLQDRKFRVGFALEFEKYVVAFVTMDNLIAVRSTFLLPLNK